MEFQYRKQNRLQNYDYSQYGAYFITICTKNREPFLSTITVPQNKTADPNVILTPFGQIVENYINMIPTKYPNTKIDAYVIMPDHVHMILVIVGDGSAVPQDKTNAVPENKTAVPLLSIPLSAQLLSIFAAVPPNNASDCAAVSAPHTKRQAVPLRIPHHVLGTADTPPKTSAATHTAAPI